jgi:hypothetical protein
MRHTVRLKGVTVGYSELEHGDSNLGRAWGVFRPGPGYGLVQPVFRIYARAVPLGGDTRDRDGLDRYYKARDAMGLQLQDDDGRSIATSGIHIADYTVEDGADALALDVLITDPAYWSRRAATPDVQ